MKNILLLTLFLCTTLVVKGQFDYNYIDRGDFYLIKAESSLKSANTKKASSLKSQDDAEQVFGKDYKNKKVLSETEGINYNKLEYDDGLLLSIPEDLKMDISFHVTSNKYALLLGDGAKIQVGMKAEDFQKVFPKSFSKRLVIENMKGKIGKILVSVYFSRMFNGQFQVEDSKIIFIFNNEKGIPYNPS